MPYHRLIHLLRFCPVFVGLLACALLAAGTVFSQTLDAFNPNAGAEMAETIPFEEIGAKATKDYRGDAIGIEATQDGARLHSRFQKLKGTVTSKGLWLDSTDGKGGRLQIVAQSIGRSKSSYLPSTLLPATGSVVVRDKAVTFSRPGLIEEYSVSVDGVRQDFIVMERPAGAGELVVELAVSGARVKSAADGARLFLTGSERALAYSRLRVVDAKGRELTARMQVISGGRLAVSVDDSAAAFPVRIDPTFSDANWVSLNPGIPGTNNSVYAATVDGGGNLYIAGTFTVVGTVAASRIAKWDGNVWSALSSGMDDSVRALAVSGTDLYAAGDFTTAGGVANTSKIAKWNGTTWLALGAGGGTGLGDRISAIVVNGSDVYAGGDFTSIGGVANTSRIAKWNGSAWSALGTGMNQGVFALAVEGVNLYASGNFTTAGGVSANRIAKWNGSTWSALGSGLSSSASALAVSGTDLYAGGGFTTAGGVTVNRIAKWNGSTWSALGSGMDNQVSALAVSGTDLFAGGVFTTANGVTVNGMAKWNGTTWSSLGTGYSVATGDGVIALAVSGTNLFVGGSFSTAGGVTASHIAKWDGSTWSRFGTQEINNVVNVLALIGSDIYAGGQFTTAGGITVNNIAKWNGSAWSSLGSGVGGGNFSFVRAMAVSGTDLYVGGFFTSAGGVANTSYIAKWNGSAWSALGTGVGYRVWSLAVSGTDLYVGGEFTTAGGVSANRIAKWNGSTWSALGTGMDNLPGALVVSGTDLYAGGGFTTAGGVTVNRIAKWNGSTWSALGSGMDNNVNTLAISGTNLYAAGSFTTAGGVSANRIAKWNGSTWSSLGTGMNSYVHALAVVGTDLYAGGDFTTAGGTAAARIAKWNGTAWSSLGSGIDSYVEALIRDGSERLIVGGAFGVAGGIVSPYLVQANLPAPGIAVEQPVGTGIDDGTASVGFGAVLIGNDVTKTFTITNSGAADLTLGAISKDGSNPADFTVNTAGMLTTVPEGGSATFTVTFTPAALGNRTAAIHIASNVSGSSNPFDINLTGIGAGAYPAAFASKATVPVTSNGFTATGSTINLSLNYAPTTGDELLVVNNTSFEPINGTFSNLANGQTVTLSYGGVNYDFVAYYFGGEDFNDLVLLWKNRRVLSWGLNTYGRLGDNSTTQRNAPVAVNTAAGASALDGKTVVSVALGESHSLALCSDGSVVAWGYNGFGQLGDDTLVDKYAPVAVNTAQGVSALYGKTVVQLAAGSGTSYALCSDGTVAAWGNDSQGSLGDDTNLSSSVAKVPVSVNTTNGVSALAGRKVRAISAGMDHAMAMCFDGSLVAWGTNSAGQLGDNTLTNRGVPVLVNTSQGVSALYGKTVKQIACGQTHNLALCSDGLVVSWGDYGNGKLGDNSDNIIRKVPVFVNTDSGLSALFGKVVTAIAASTSHSMALCDDGQYVGWGKNTNGRVGDSTTSGDRMVPVFVNASTGGSALIGKIGRTISAGDIHNLAIMSDGNLVAWGGNLNGQIGIGNTSSSQTPVVVNGGALTYGEKFVAALSGKRAVHNLTIVATPPFVPEITVEEPVGNGLVDGAASVGFGTATLGSGGVAKTFTIQNLGAAPLSGLAVSKDGVNAADFTLGSLGATTLAAGATTTFTVTFNPALPGDKTAAIHVTSNDADENTFDINLAGTGQGAFTATFSSASDTIITSPSFTATGSSVNLVLNFAPTPGTDLRIVDNTGLPFIQGTFSNLAQGQTVALPFGTAVYNFVANYYGGTGNDLVLVWAKNRAFGWGDNVNYGSVGDGTTIQRPLPVPLLSTGLLANKTILEVATRADGSLILCSDGTLASWGRNNWGQVGDNSTNTRFSPVAVNAENGVSSLFGRLVVKITTGGEHCMVICSDGTLSGWGSNQAGALGFGASSGTRIYPTQVANGEESALYGKTVVQVACGNAHNIALCADGTLVAWGDNSEGQLGTNGSPPYATKPVLVSRSQGVSALYGKDVIQVAASSQTSYALCSDGTLVSWGRSSYGQIGDGFTTTRYLPVLVNTAQGTSALAGKSVVGISAGLTFVLARCSDGTLVSWGENDVGQLGDNSKTQRSNPTAVNTLNGTSSLHGKSVTEIATGSKFTLALASDGSLHAWGSNTYGQCGLNGGGSDVQVPNLVNTSQLSAGEQFIKLFRGFNSTHALAIVASPPPPPTVTTLAATSITGTSAVLNGTINANGSGAAASFDHGTSTGYVSNVAATPAVVTGDTNVPVTATLTGLQPGTQYFFRARGTDTVGSGLSFTTLSADANLASLTLSSGSLSPVFDAGTLSYTASVGYRSYSLTVTPTKAQANATITVNGVPVVSGAASGSIPLSVGPNVITTVVTAQDGMTTKTYTVTVTRAVAAPGDVEEGFDVGIANANYVLAAVTQPDGKIIIGGGFSEVGGAAHLGVARLEANGAPDASFTASANADVHCLLLQDDGKIILGGQFTQVNGVARSRIARLNADGTLDAGFDPGVNAVVLGGAMQADGKVLIAGGFTTVGGTARSYAARLNVDGSLDTSFNADANATVMGISPQSDGKILAWGGFTAIGGGSRSYVARMDAVGTLDTGFAPPTLDNYVRAAQTQADGKILLGGDFTTVDGGGTRQRILRLNVNGSLDTSFTASVNDAVMGICQQADGDFLINGFFTSVSGNDRGRIARFHSNGSLDTSFNPDANHIVYALALQADGRVLAAGSFTAMSGLPRNMFAKLHHAPSTNALAATSFDRVEWLRGGTSPEAQRVTFELSTNGGTIWNLLGNATRIAGGWELSSLALPTSGQIRARARIPGGYDSGSSGLVETITNYSGLPVPDIAVFNGTEMTAPNERTDNTGTHSFGTADLASVNTVQTFSIRNDGTVALSGLALSVTGTHAGDFTLGSLGATTLAPGASTSFSVTFSPQGFGARGAVISLASNDFDETPFEIVVGGTGGNVLAASFSAANTIPLTTNGFTAAGSAVNFTLNFAPAPFSTLTVVNNTSANPISGVFSNLAQAQTVTLSFGGNDYRYFADYFGGDGNDLVLVLQGPGVLDYTFANRGRAMTPVGNGLDQAKAVVVQPDGRIVVAGTSHNGSNLDFMVARYLPDGRLDPSFNSPHGFNTTAIGSGNEEASSVALQPDGKIVAVGYTRGTNNDFALVRYTSDGLLDVSFGTGGLVTTAVTSGDDTAYGVTLQQDGKIVVVGEGYQSPQPDFAVVRYTASGVPDSGFGTAGIVLTDFGSNKEDRASGVCIQRDGKIVVAGHRNNSGTLTFALARYTSAGVLDLDFDADGKVLTTVGTNNDVAVDVVIQSDGRIIAGGYSATLPGNTPAKFALVRYGPDGTLDAGFGSGGKVTTVMGTDNDTAHDLVLQADGKILLMGNSFNGSTKSFALARYNASGGLDATLNGTGKLVFSLGTGDYRMALQPDGKIVAAGWNSNGSNNDVHVARFIVEPFVSAGFAGASNVPLRFEGLDATGRRLDLSVTFVPNPGTSLKVFENTSQHAIIGAFTGMPHGQPVTLGGANFVLNYFGGDGNDLTLEWANTKLAAFGSNLNGQLGITGTASQANVPTQVVATVPIYQKTILSMSAGEAHSLAVCSDGTVAAWGSNANGQLGNGTTTSATTPVAVTMSGVLSGKMVIAVAAGGQHSLALCSDGTLAAWGDGSFGQIGDGGVLDRPAPVLVNTAGALSGKRVIAISAGANHSAALCSDGTVVCWGGNASGELGNGSNTQSNVPVAVAVPMPNGVMLGRTAVAVACGQTHTLALLADGAVAAWGLNASGQLGNGSTTASNVPVLVSTAGLLNGKRVVEIAAGGSSSLARSSDGVLAAWGLNDSGQLGVNSATTSFTNPQAVHMSGVLSGKTVTRLFAGQKHAGALCSDGTLSTWGEGTGGELGNNTVLDSLQPVLATTTILGGTDVFVPTSSGASAGHSLALIGTSANAPSIQVEHLGSLLVDGSGTQSFGSTYVTSTRTKVFTIQNNGTQVLNGIAATINGTAANIAHYSIPAQPPTSLQPGEAASFSVNFTPTSTGSKPVTLRIANNLSAPLNPFDVNLTGTASPSFTFTFTTPSDVAVNSAAFNAGGKTITLLLGHVPATGSSLMVVNNTGPGFISGVFSNLAQGQTVALTFNSITYNFVANYFGGNGNDLVLNWKDTRLMAWGANSSGTLGTGSTTQANTPVAVNMSGVLNGKTIVSLASGERHSLALCADNTLAAWGANDQGQLGTGNTTPSTLPVAVPMNGALTGKTIAAIAAGYDFSLALCSDGTVAAWGTNGSGQLGNNSLTGSSTPVAVSAAGVLSGKVVTGIAAGYDFSSARCADGTIVAWGANHSGQLGNGTNDDSLVPVAVTASGVLSGRTVTSIAAGNYFVLALCSDGRIAAWGDNGFGTLGDGTVDPSNVPVLVSNSGLFAGKTPVRIAAGQYHSTALCGDGTLGVWGDNTIGPGQLGVSGTDSYLTPGLVNTVGVLAGKTISSVAVGQNHNIALLADGTLAAWGFSAFGQLGNGNTTYSELPVLVNLGAVAAGERILQAASGNTAQHTVISLAMPVASGGAPAVTTNAAESINKTTATLKGLVNPNGAATDARFDYGLTTSYGTQTAIQAIGSGSNSVTVTQNLTSLQPNTTYHYRVTATNTGGTANGNDLTFTTLPDPPVAVNGTASGITNTGATLNGSVNPNTRATTAFFRVSTDASFATNTFTTAPQNISAGSSFVGVSAPLSGLLFGTTYYYRLVAQNAAGEAEDMAAQSFTTTSVGIATQPPTISSTTALNLTTTSARLQGSVNPNGGLTNVFFEYGPAPGFGTNSINYSAGSGTSPQTLVHDIGGLLPATQYQFRLIAENNFNNSTTTTGATFTFTTLPLPPIVETHAAAALSTTSARLNGKVNAQNGSAVVTFEWGTDGVSFPNSLTAVPSPVTGSALTNVSIDLANLAQFTTYHFRVKAVSAGGTTMGSVLTFQPAIISGLTQEFPNAPPASNGSLTVSLAPTGLLSGWRFVGEHRWRASGDTATGLVHGSRVIEFRPVPGYLQPGTDTVNVTSAGQVADYEYYATPSAGTGGILVVLKPDTLAQASNVVDRGQWRLLGETAWRDSATTASSLSAGSYLIECKAVSGYSTPVLVNIAVSSGQTVNPTIVYADAFSPTGTPPAVVSFSTVSTDSTKPYGYVGQIRSNSGVGTGFAVKSRVVATAAHVVFDEGSQSSVQGLQWLLQEDAGGHEPLPVTPRGYYLIDGYAAQRATETPGSFSLASRQKDVAALYFINDTDAARTGFAGYLASDLTNNEFLTSSAQKMLVGYPVDGIATLDQGRMHATPAANLSFSGLTDRVFATTGIRSTGGNSGGPLCVQHTNGKWYPAAVYLGGATQSIVRAIDSTVIQLFNTAQQSGIDDQGYTGGGITHTGYTVGGTASTGALIVNITPAGTGWRPLGSTKPFTPSGISRAGLTPGTFSIEFTPLAGYQTPANQSVTVVAASTQTYSITYQSSQTPQETWRQTFFGTTANTGNAADTFDFDGDGFTNAQEYAAGTNPTLSGDYFRITDSQRTASTFTVNTAGKAGRTYTLQRSTQLTSWSSVTSQGPLVADGAVTLMDSAMPNDAAFYRIVVTGP